MDYRWFLKEYAQFLLDYCNTALGKCICSVICLLRFVIFKGILLKGGFVF